VHPIWIFLLSLCLLWITGCSSQKKNSRKGENQISVQDTVKTNSDSMPTPAPPPPGLPPGQAKIKGEIVEAGELSDSPGTYYLKLKVDQVLGYGASVPPVGTTDTLTVMARGSDQNRYKIGKIVSAVISYRQLLGDSGNSSRWTLVKLENDSN